MNENLNLDQILSKDGARIYFIGIGGIAMSAVANIAKDFGFEVLGSDSKEVYAPAKDVLDANEINYFIGYDEKHVKDAKADLFVVSAGEDQHNPELKYVLDNNLPRVGLAELLFELSKDCLRVVIAGTNGKSTTTGLVGHLFRNLDNSSFMTGAVLQNYQSNFHKGDGHYFVFEGDEYKEQFDDPTPKFHYYKPDILVLTNLEYDHPDQFASMADLEREFAQLIETMPEDGLIIYNADDANLSKLVHASNISTVSFGIDNDADFKVENITYGEHTTIHVNNKFSKDQIGKLLEKDEEYQIQLPGRMNVYNALAAIATLRTLGFSRENIVLDLLTYQGVKRRFEVVGSKNGITIVDDYAHHPTAVKETIEAARLKYFSNTTEFSPHHRSAVVLAKEDGGDVALATERVQKGGKLWAVFEPHTFSRTKATINELAKSFDSADQVLISEIYPARESVKDATITSEQVVEAVVSVSPSPPMGEMPSAAEAERVQSSELQRGRNVRLVHNKQEALDIIKSEAKPGDVVIIMAVGSFNRLAYELMESF